jgi:hypothetical protein
MPRRTWLLALVILAAVAGIELAMGRNPICTCGAVDLWVAQRDSPRTSQMFADWYSLSHIVHGLLFYAILWLFFRRLDIGWRFLIAFALEASWEVIENTPMVIDRYRATTAALGYTGDSIVNSLSDVLMMALGFLIASKLPVRTSILILILLELVPLQAIRDNLTLNIIALVAPNPAIQAWQAG